MDVAAIEPTSGATSPDCYELMLKESIDRFLVELKKGVSDFSNFGSIFFRLVQTMVDPPLEVIWFYSVVSCRSSNFSVQDPPNRVLMAKDLFQLLVSCSVSCNGLKSVAALAPVVYKLYQLVYDKKHSREIECLIEGIVSYMSLRCCKCSDDDDVSVGLKSCFVDLVRVWTVDGFEENRKFGEDLRVFFPLVSDEIRRRISVGCGVGYLAGVVMCEAFFMRLCLKFGSGSGVSRAELQKDMQNWAVHTITGFRNCYFFDNLLRMLLEPVLPVTSLLSSEDDVLLREVLYDAVIMVEYSSLHPERGIQLPADHLKNLAVTWSFVVDNAIQFVRQNCDQSKAISYMNAFSKSHLFAQLIKWVTNQTGMEEMKSRSNVSTPIALIKWLLIIEGQGIRVFDHNISVLDAKAVIGKSRVDYEFSEFKLSCKNPNDNLFFCIDNEGRGEDNKVDGEQEMVDSLDDAFLSAACTMNSTTNGIRKRKEGRNNEGETRVKFVKYHIHESPVSEKFLPFCDNDGFSSGSEVENPVFDEDMEDMEQ